MTEVPLPLRSALPAVLAGARRHQADRSDFTSLSFLVGHNFDIGTLKRVKKIAHRWAVAPHEVLLSQGWISPQDYTKCLAQALGVECRFVLDSVNQRPPRLGSVLLDATGAPPHEIAVQVDRQRAQGKTVVLYSNLMPDAGDSTEQRRSRAIHAISSLHIAAPEASAKRRHPDWLKTLAVGVFGTIIGAALVDAWSAYLVLIALITILFLVIVGLRILTLTAHLIWRDPRLPIPTRLKTTSDLPVYSVLVPLFDEAEILPSLIEALSRLDYPTAKLDVILVLEDADRRTRQAAEAIRLPDFIRTISVPNMQPRTKPKALNYALSYARGDFVVIFDAEDVPEPRQLHHALRVFSENPHIDCLQARLNIYNSRSNWLTRQFALEYTVLFDGLLPALERLSIPIPLGGTSNHFRCETLERAGGWDPFNVTEDADLGLRLCRYGAGVGILKSTTWEQAPVTLNNWLPQRTRWIKG